MAKGQKANLLYDLGYGAISVELITVNCQFFLMIILSHGGPSA